MQVVILYTFCTRVMSMQAVATSCTLSDHTFGQVAPPWRRGPPSMASRWIGEGAVLRGTYCVAHSRTQPCQLRLQLPASSSGHSQLLFQALGFHLGVVGLSAQLAGPCGGCPQSLLQLCGGLPVLLVAPLLPILLILQQFADLELSRLQLLQLLLQRCNLQYLRGQK